MCSLTVADFLSTNMVSGTYKHGTYACIICSESVRGGDALHCAQCSSNPVHVACVVRSPFAETCTQCSGQTMQLWRHRVGASSATIDLVRDEDSWVGGGMLKGEVATSSSAKQARDQGEVAAGSGIIDEILDDAESEMGQREKKMKKAMYREGLLQCRFGGYRWTHGAWAGATASHPRCINGKGVIKLYRHWKCCAWEPAARKFHVNSSRYFCQSCRWRVRKALEASAMRLPSSGPRRARSLRQILAFCDDIGNCTHGNVRDLYRGLAEHRGNWLCREHTKKGG